MTANRPSDRPPRLALVTCVRNEAEWLPAFLRYHHAVGVGRAYVFLDRCTDDATAAVAGSFPWVRLFRLDPSEAAQFTYISDLQCACMNHAFALARREGIPWLLMIDVDEYACGDNPGATTPLERAHLLPMLDRVRWDTLQVRLPTRELAPALLAPAAPFWEQRYFQTGPKLAWTIHDPLTGAQTSWRDFLGHRQGKAIIRTGAAVQAYDAHRWVQEQGVRWPTRPEPALAPTEKLGYHLHYYVVDQRHWLKKFPKQQAEPPVWFCGSPVELPKQCWKVATGQLPAAQLEGYFERWIARHDDELATLAEQGLVVKDTIVRDVLAATGVLRRGRLPLPWRLRRSCQPEDFRPLTVPAPTPASVGAYPLTHVAALEREGFYGLEYNRGAYFRWAQPQAAIRLHAPPGDYQLRLDMKHLARFWRGRLNVRLNDRAVTGREPKLNQVGTLTLPLHRDDFPDTDALWLRLEFDPIDTSRWPKRAHLPLGAPLFGIYLDAA